MPAGVAISRRLAQELDRRAVAEFGMHSLQLMENAGRGVADELRRLAPAGPVTICCGWGNNGGDGFVVARHLDLGGAPVRVLLFVPPERLARGAAATSASPPDAQSLGLKGDVAVNYAIVRASGLSLHVLSAPDEARALLAGSAWIVDALLGTGAQGEPRSPLAEAIDAMNAAEPPILAVDLPSGLDAERGPIAQRIIRAVRTCTFVAPKPGLVVSGAQAWTGEITVLDIGAPRRLVEEILAQAEAENARS